MLKQNRYEPDIENAKNAGEIDLADQQGVNTRAFDVLRSCPGITGKNIVNVLNKVSSFAELVNYPLEELGEILGDSNAKLFYDFAHHEPDKDSGKEGGAAAAK